MHRAFTLIELLIVVVILGALYALYFFTGAKHLEKKVAFSTATFYHFLNAKEMLLCSRDKEKCYLLDKERNLVRSFDFYENITEYTLQKGESLTPTLYNALEVSPSLYIIPSLLYKKDKNGVASLLIYYDEEAMQWVYINPYSNKTHYFKNQENLIRFITKKEYLPKNRGLAQ